MQCLRFVVFLVWISLVNAYIDDGWTDDVVNDDFDLESMMEYYRKAPNKNAFVDDRNFDDSVNDVSSPLPMVESGKTSSEIVLENDTNEVLTYSCFEHRNSINDGMSDSGTEKTFTRILPNCTGRHDEELSVRPKKTNSGDIYFSISLLISYLLILFIIVIKKSVAVKEKVFNVTSSPKELYIV